jgi:hypothetical protein
MSELGLWATVVTLAGIAAVLLIGQARRRPAPERDGSRHVPTDSVWLRPGEVAHTIHPSGPEAATAVVLGPTTLVDLLVDRPSASAQRIREGLEGLGLAGFDADRVVDAIGGLLDRPVTGLVLQAWDEQPSVQDACARTRNVPGATAFVVVTEHTLYSEQRPRLHVAAAGRPEVVLELILTVALTIDAVTITVVEGRVTGCVAGTTASTVELSVVAPDGSMHELARRESDSVALGPHEPAAAGTGPHGTVR